MKNEIRYYLRDKKRNPFALLLAKKYDNGQVMISWSKCCIKKNNKEESDHFSKKEAVRIAYNRMIGIVDIESPIIPYSIQKNILIFTDRAKKFFRVDDSCIVNI